MKAKLFEPVSSKYIYVDPEHNELHLLMPIVSGTDIGLDNTCKMDRSMQDFFSEGKAGVGYSLANYKKALENDLKIIPEITSYTDIIKQKKYRLKQVNDYIELIEKISKTVQGELDNRRKNLIAPILEKKSNLYGMLLRPVKMDNQIKSVSPVFSVFRRGNSPLFNALNSVISSEETLPKKISPQEQFTQLVLKTLDSKDGQPIDFNALRDQLSKKTEDVLGIAVDFYHSDYTSEELNKAFFDREMNLDDGSDPSEYINALIGYCAPHLFDNKTDSLFNKVQSHEDAEHLSILTQFYLAQVNIFCVSEELSSTNFGKVLDDSEALSSNLKDDIQRALRNNESIESALFQFVNKHHIEFGLSRLLYIQEKNIIDTTFKKQFIEIQESPHFDEFRVVNTQKKGLFVTHQGSICTDLSELISTKFPDLMDPYITQIHENFKEINGDITHQNLSVLSSININIEDVDNILELVALLQDPSIDGINQLALIKECGETKLISLLQDRMQLATLLTVLPSVSIQRALFDILGSKLDELLQTPEQLVDLLHKLPNNNAQATLILSLDNKIYDLVSNSTPAQLAAMLLGLSPSPQFAMIKSLGTHLKTIIKNPADLAEFCNSSIDCSAEDEPAFGLIQMALETLGKPCLHNYFDDFDLDHLLTFISEQPLIHELLITTLSPQLQMQIKNGEHLAYVLQMLYEEDKPVLIKCFDERQLRTLIENGDQFEKLLKIWPNKKEFLSLFNATQLESIAEKSPGWNDRFLSLYSDDLLPLISPFNSAQLQVLIHNAGNLHKILGILPDNASKEALIRNLDAKKLEPIYQDPAQWITGYHLLPSQETKIMFINHFAPVKLQAIIDYIESNHTLPIATKNIISNLKECLLVKPCVAEQPDGALTASQIAKTRLQNIKAEETKSSIQPPQDSPSNRG